MEFIESFKIDLAGGIAPNSGRVEVKYDEVWFNVCYESDELDTSKWSFTNAEVVCNELGFPGTMLAGQGGQGNGTRESVVSGYKCRKGQRMDSLFCQNYIRRGTQLSFWYRCGPEGPQIWA